MGRASVRPVLVKYLTDHVGETVHLDTMISDTGLNKAQIQQGMFRLSEAGFVEVILRSNVWIYRPEPQDRTASPAVPGEAEVNGAVSKAREIAERLMRDNEAKNGQVVEYVKEPLDLFELVKELKGDRLLIQDTEGVLYVASKLDI